MKLSPDLTRRDMIRRVGLGLLGGASFVNPTSASAVPAQASATPDGAGTPIPRASHNRFPRMVQEYYVARVREVERLADKRRAGLRSKQDAESYVNEARRKIRQCFGPWPEKTPLNPKVMGVLD